MPVILEDIFVSAGMLIIFALEFLALYLLASTYVADRAWIVQNDLGCHDVQKTRADFNQGLIPRFQQHALTVFVCFVTT
jgi:hypothetical protein